MSDVPAPTLHRKAMLAWVTDLVDYMKKHPGHYLMSRVNAYDFWSQTAFGHKENVWFVKIGSDKTENIGEMRDNDLFLTENGKLVLSRTYHIVAPAMPFPFPIAFDRELIINQAKAASMRRNVAFIAQTQKDLEAEIAKLVKAQQTCEEFASVGKIEDAKDHYRKNEWEARQVAKLSLIRVPLIEDMIKAKDIDYDTHEVEALLGACLEAVKSLVPDVVIDRLAAEAKFDRHAYIELYKRLITTIIQEQPEAGKVPNVIEMARIRMQLDMAVLTLPELKQVLEKHAGEGDLRIVSRTAVEWMAEQGKILEDELAGPQPVAVPQIIIDTNKPALGDEPIKTILPSASAETSEASASEPQSDSPDTTPTAQQ